MTAVIQQSAPLFRQDFINDLRCLPENEDIIIEFLLERLQRGQIYTWVGPLLLTLNPNNEMSTANLYSSLELDKHTSMSVTINETEPHIFTVAAKAHYSLTRDLGRNCQVIVISGETGTGKTFNACKCLEFLSEINKNLMLPSQGDYMHNIMLKIMDACRLISAFATASTDKNEVSSRHGQLVQLHYKNEIISGATINSFLLERSRVTKGSSNFQIFYQMMFGMSGIELGVFNLSKNENYDILNDIDHNKREQFHESFQDTLKALKVLGLNDNQKKNIFQVLALLIHMGNIKFVEDGETCTINVADRRSKEALKNTSMLSSLPEEVIVELLTTILINPRSVWRKHTTYHRHLATVDACRNRLHSIIRYIYDLLFRWILNCVNKALFIKHEYSKWLGILDIFGFECFNRNGIEQLCVNYANEKMQQYFIKIHLENNYKDLQEEGFIESSRPLHIINLYKERLNVLEEALFVTLNDACQSPVIIDTNTVIKLACGSSHNTERKFLNEKEGNFVIEHYSGPVAYSVEDLLSRNTDKVPNEISVIFNASENKFLRSLINAQEEQCSNRMKTCCKKRTMLAKLKYNIDTLITELSKCDLHYVRCVRPSRLKSDDWNRKNFRKQLACIGIFDVLPLFKCKYPFRLQYKDFYQRYAKKPAEVDDIDKCKMILESVVCKKELNSTIYYGKQMIFLTNSIFIKLECYRRNYRIKCANKIRAFWMKHRRKLFLSANKIQDDTSNDKVIPVKVTLDRDAKKSNSSEESDDVFITTLIPPKDSSLTNPMDIVKMRMNNLNATENLHEIPAENKLPCKKQGILGNLHDYENWKKKCSNLKHQVKDLYAENGLRSNITKLIKKIHLNPNSKCKHCKDSKISKNSSEANRRDSNNNNSQELNTLNTEIIDCLMNREVLDWCEHKCCMHYRSEKNVHTMQMDSHTLFYKNRILSRRQLATVPIRIYTRSTCLTNSHVIPHSLLPRGLEDCL